MSLINQVLQDLDRRHAEGGGVPSAVKALPATAGDGRYWRVIAISAVAVVIVGGGAGVAAWSMRARAPSVAASETVTHAPTPVVMAAASAVKPVAVEAKLDRPVAVAAAKVDGKPVDSVGTLRSTDSTKALAPSLGSAPQEAGRKPAAQVTERVEPAKPSVAASAPTTSLATAPLSVAATLANASVTHGESRIEKRAPNRTAHERAEAEYNKGVAAHQHGQLAEAAAAYTAALREEASFASARQALGGVMISQGRSDDARKLLSDGIALAPQHAGLAMTLARLHVERGELQRAAEVLQPSDATSMSAEDHAFRAAVLQRLNRHAEASDHFAAALRTAPNNGVWWMGLGISQAAEGRNDDAKEAFNRARSSGSLSAELAQYVEQLLRQL